MQERGRRNGRYKMIKGGGLLAWKLCSGKLVVGGVVLLVYRSLGIYRKIKAGENRMNNGQTNATICMTWQECDAGVF